MKSISKDHLSCGLLGSIFSVGFITLVYYIPSFQHSGSSEPPRSQRIPKSFSIICRIFSELSKYGICELPFGVESVANVTFQLPQSHTFVIMRA